MNLKMLQSLLNVIYSFFTLLRRVYGWAAFKFFVHRTIAIDWLHFHYFFYLSFLANKRLPQFDCMSKALATASEINYNKNASASGSGSAPLCSPCPSGRSSWILSSVSDSSMLCVCVCVLVLLAMPGTCHLDNFYLSKYKSKVC